MKTLKNILHCAALLALCLAPQHILAQDTPSTTAAPLEFKNHASWGVNYAGGDATFGRGTLMLSTSYGRHILPWLELEGTAQGFAWSEAFSFGSFPAAISVQPNSVPAVSWNSNAVFLDATAMMQPFQGFGLRVGLGPSARWWSSSRLSIGWGSSQLQGAPKEETFLVVQNEQARSWSFGANAKLEYLIPISQQIDVSVRAQGHIFARPFDGAFPQPYSTMGQIGGGASLGAFLRINF
jgi:hypothetical protein